MREKRRAEFLRAVAEAARKAPAKPRGRPMPGNMTEVGRRLGLEAIARAPRCRTIRRNGERCKNPAMRGATRCLKHGGRIEVPAHPHNIRRLLSGDGEQPHAYARGREVWDRMSLAEQREFLAMVPAHLAKKQTLVFQAAWTWRQIRDQGYPAFRRFLLELSGWYNERRVAGGGIPFQEHTLCERRARDG